jgi:hypothetical protein
LLARPGPIVAVEHSLAPLSGLNRCFAATALALHSGVRFGLVALLLFLLLWRLRRLRGIAPACVGLVLAVIAYTSLVNDLSRVNSLALLMALAMGASIFLLLRLGHLALVLALFLDVIVGLLFPNTTRLTGWYAGCTWWVIMVAVLLTGYGVYYSTGGRPFGAGALLKD